MFNRRSRSIQVVASGAGAVAAGGSISNVVADMGAVVQVGRVGNRRSKTHQISNNLELISDGSIVRPMCFEIINGEIFINGRKVAWAGEV